VQMPRYFVGETSRGFRRTVGSGRKLVLVKDPFKFLGMLGVLAGIFEWEDDAVDTLRLGEGEGEKTGAAGAGFGGKVGRRVNARRDGTEALLRDTSAISQQRIHQTD
jgi:hypothetical protein